MPDQKKTFHISITIDRTTSKFAIDDVHRRIDKASQHFVMVREAESLQKDMDKMVKSIKEVSELLESSWENGDLRLDVRRWITAWKEDGNPSRYAIIKNSLDHHRLDKHKATPNPIKNEGE